MKEISIQNYIWKYWPLFSEIHKKTFSLTEIFLLIFKHKSGKHFSNKNIFFRNKWKYWTVLSYSVVKFMTILSSFFIHFYKKVFSLLKCFPDLC